MNRLACEIRVGAVTLLAAMIVGCQHDPANTKPSASQPPVRVAPSKAYVAALIKWRETCYLKEYQSVGQTDPKWNAKVESLISRTVGHGDNWGRLTTGERSEIMADFASVRAAGCTDPLLLALHAMVLLKEKQVPEAVAAAQSALSGFTQSKYTFSTRLTAASTAYFSNMAANKPGEAQKAALTLRDWLVKSAADWVYRDECQGFYAEIFKDCCLLDMCSIRKDIPLNRENGTPQAMLALMLSLKDADPWIKAYVAGKCHDVLGWMERGGGYADTVTEAGWKGFDEHIREARRYFTEAYPLHPQFPHIAAAMISIAMTSCDSKETRLWFDRTVAAQFDYMQAYSTYLWSLRPRWGGSHEAMLAFGRECLATKRFETEVPYYYMASLRDIASELPDPDSLYQRQDLWTDITAYFEGRLGVLSDAGERRYQDSFYAAVAWGALRPRDAAAIYKRSVGKLVEGATQRVHLRADSLECLLKVCAGEEGVELQKAFSAYVSAKTASALANTLRLAASVKDPDVAVGLNEFLIHQPLTPPSAAVIALVDLLESQGRTELLFRQWDASVKQGLEGPAALIVSNRVQQVLGQTGMALAGKLHDGPITSADEFKSYVASVESLIPKGTGSNDLEKTQRALGRLRARFAWCCIGPQERLNGICQEFVRRECRHLMRQCPDKAALLEFMTEALGQKKMCYRMKAYLAQEYHMEHQKSPWREFDKEKAIIAGLESATGTEEQLLAACRREFKRRGTLSLALRIAHMLHEKGLEKDARGYEKLVARWVDVLMENYPYTWSVMFLYNLVPGYEQNVLDAATLRPDGNIADLDSHWYILADAYLRMGNTKQAQAMLEKGGGLKKDQDVFVNPFGRFDTSPLYGESLRKRLQDQIAKAVPSTTK